MLNLKTEIMYNFDLEVNEQDEMNRLWIQHKELRIHFDKVNDDIYASTFGKINETSTHDSTIIKNPDHVLLYLLRYCKDVHKWGEFKNLN